MPVIKNLMVRAGADFSPITQQARRAQRSMEDMSRGVRTSCDTMSSAVRGLRRAFGALGIAISAAALVSFAKEARTAYDEACEAEAKLAQVMRNTMGASAAEIREIRELTAAQQALGVIGDDVQQEGAQELATYLELTSSLKTLIPVMNDMLAQQYGLNATGENAANIATMLGKVMNGQTSALSRYGYAFTKAQEQILKFGTESERAAVLAEVVEESVGGMNRALAMTPSGRLKQVSDTLGDIKEQFGKAVTTILTVFLPVINAVATALAGVATIAGRVAQSIANVFGRKSAAAAVSYKGVALGAERAAAGAGALAAATDRAGKAAKKLSTVGFDTLQKLTVAAASGTDAATDEIEGAEVGGGARDRRGRRPWQAGGAAAAVAAACKRVAAVPRRGLAALECDGVGLRQDDAAICRHRLARGRRGAGGKQCVCDVAQRLFVAARDADGAGRCDRGGGRGDPRRAGDGGGGGRGRGGGGRHGGGADPPALG